MKTLTQIASAITSARIRRNDKGKPYEQDTTLLSSGKIVSRRVTEPSDRALQKSNRIEAPLTQRYKHLLRGSAIKPMNIPDAFGNTGMGRLGKLVDVAPCCGRRSKVVGPLSAPIERRSCVPTCKDQRGQHPITSKIRALPREQVG